MSGPRDPQAVDNLPPAHVPARREPAWGQRFAWRAWPVAAVWLIGAAPSLVATTPVTAQAADTAGTASPAAQPRAIDLWRRMRAVEPRHYVAYRTAQPLAIDGRLDEPAWRSGSASAPFVDITANPALAPRHQTRMKICWDDEYLYVGAELDEPHVWATIVEHDAVIFRDPDFEVFIDPDSDNHDYYEFEMNALNTGWDLRLPKPYRDGGSALNEWEIAGLKTAVHVRGTLNDPADQDQGWSVELAFPWRALAEFTHTSAPPADGDQWRIDFSRVEWQVRVENGHYVKLPGLAEDNWVWSPTGIVDMHRPEKWGFVQFSTLGSGDIAFVADATTPCRRLLHAVYYCQQDYHERHGRWAQDLGELRRDVDCAAVLSEEPGGLPASLEIRPIEDGYLAAVALPQPAQDGATRLEIRHDSRIRRVQP